VAGLHPSRQLHGIPSTSVSLAHSMQFSEFNVSFQWLINSYGPEGSLEVKAKPMEALKKLGHEKLKLDEYESACTYSTRLRILLRYSYLFRANRVRSDPSR
jgi:hypothetical protein